MHTTIVNVNNRIYILIRLTINDVKSDYLIRRIHRRNRKQVLIGQCSDLISLYIPNSNKLGIYNDITRKMCIRDRKTIPRSDAPGDCFYVMFYFLLTNFSIRSIATFRLSRE